MILLWTQYNIVLGKKIVEEEKTKEKQINGSA